MSKQRLGIDIGGTFTDFCLMDGETGEVRIVKIPSSPDHPTRSVTRGIGVLMERHALDPRDVEYFVHGTTIAVNTVIERKGAVVGLLVTTGFRDVLNLGRSRLPDIFDFLTEKPEPLVARRHVRTIDERMLHNGEVHRPLDENEVLRAAAELIQEGVEAITVSFIHAYRNPAHELRARDIVRAAHPDIYVCTSSEIWPQIREYERTMVSVTNAYIGRKMFDYFAALEEEVAATGIGARLLSTKSNGGIMTAASARVTPVETLSSGPASGVIGARFVGAEAGHTRLIGLDMGGTSTEVSVIDGDVRYATESRVGEFEIVMPSVDVTSIGAGGGSIAWTDPAGVLKVGPKSAGADPGPACYGLGGTAPTITDAYVVMGIIDPAKFVGGELVLNREAAETAIAGIAQVIGMDKTAAAEALLRVATSNMYAELVPLMARKGVDVTEFALLVYGGAGPTHGFALAKEVGIRTVLVPRAPGALCALGALVADVKSDFIATLHLTLDPEDGRDACAVLRNAFANLESQAGSWITGENIRVAEERFTRGADMRYLGQSFEIFVDFGGIDLEAPDAVRRITAAFRDAYAVIYGHADEGAPVEVINLRVTAIGDTVKPRLSRIARPSGGEPPPSGTRRVFFEGEMADAAVFDRNDLVAGQCFDGPAIVEQYDTTTFVPKGFACRVDDYGTIIGERI